MKKTEILVNAVILLTIVLCVCTAADFLALHDVNKDYVSQAALQYLEVTTSKELPTWTGTQMEWATITISYLTRMVVIILSLWMLFGAKRELRNYQAG